MPFTAGHTISKGIGRPKGSKNILPIIREKVLNKLHYRIKELDKIAVEELLSFAKAIMPKDVTLNVVPNISYISSCPRPAETIDTVGHTVEETPKELEVKKVDYTNPNAPREVLTQPNVVTNNTTTKEVTNVDTTVSDSAGVCASAVVKEVLDSQASTEDE